MYLCETNLIPSEVLAFWQVLGLLVIFDAKISGYNLTEIHQFIPVTTRFNVFVFGK